MRRAFPAVRQTKSRPSARRSGQQSDLSAWSATSCERRRLRSSELCGFRPRGLKTKKPRQRPGPRDAAGSLGGLKVCRRRPAGPFVGHNIECEFLALLQTAQARLLHGAHVDENVFATVIWPDEA